MGKRGSMKYQIIKRIDEMKRFGQSKHMAKKEEKEKCLTEGRPWNPARVEGIFSFSTAATYKKEVIVFSEWAKETHGVKNIEDVKPMHVQKYLEEGMEKGHSPWTLHMRAAALSKVFEISREDFTEKMGFQLPSRKREKITRSRLPRSHDAHFSEKNHSDIVNFAIATGLRRLELLNLKPEDIGDDGIYVKGKGGRERIVPPIKKAHAHVRRCKEQAQKNGQEKVFSSVPGKMDVHSYRREYAQARYGEVVQRQDFRGKQYKAKDGRVFETKALYEVSRNLGHSRLDVVVGNYLD